MTAPSRMYRPLVAPSTSSELRAQVQQILQRIEDSQIDAFSWVQRAPASVQDDAAVDRLIKLPLAGMPIAVKEVIDVAGTPIGYGCDAFAGRTATVSADVVTQLEALGGQVLGITRSTEMAIARETTTRNPWSLDHSPGASSSGSAAAVGAGLVPFALGTQTIGSIIRPAAYCGVFGFKPSAGIGSRRGVLSLSDTLDHVGYFADSLERMTNTVSVLFPDLLSAPKTKPRFIFVEPWFDCQELEYFVDQISMLQTACDSAGIDWVEKSFAPAVTARETGLVKTLLCFEMFQKWGKTLLNHPATSDELQSFLQSGETITPAEYELALNSRHEMIEYVEGELADGDIIVFPSVLGHPPKLGQGTGSRDPQRLWTLLGFPALNLPVGWNENFPFNLQLIAKRDADLHLLESANLVSQLFDRAVSESLCI